MNKDRTKEALQRELEELKLQFLSLKESEERFRGLFENASDGIWGQDMKGNFTWANQVTENIIGYSLEEFLRMNIKELLTPESLINARIIKRRFMRRESIPVYQIEVKAKDGHLVPLELNSHLILRNGEPVGIQSILRDVSDRILSEQMHLESERKYRALMDHSSDAIVLGEFEGNLIEFNLKAKSLLGYSNEELANTKLVRIFCKEEHERIRDFLAELYEKGSAYINDILILTKSGKTFPAEVTSTVIEYGSKKLVHSVIQDISQRKRNKEIITRQAQEIMEISTPIVQVWKGVVAAPLIGTLDSQRAEQFTEQLLEKIVETNSPLALVDITGVPAIDTRTAQHIIETISAVRLLGGQVILTGVRPAIAQTLVHLGIDLKGVVTRPSLAAGLQVALQELGLQVTNNKDC